MLHNPEVCLADVGRKERCHAIHHLVQHRTEAPPVRLEAVPVRLLLCHLCVVLHLKRDERLLVCGEDFGRDVVARPARHETVPPGHTPALQRRRGAKVDEQNV